MNIAPNAGHTVQNDAWTMQNDGWPRIMLATTHLMFTSGLQGEKTSKFFFVPNELKSPKNTWGWVGGWVRSKCGILHTFLNPSLIQGKIKSNYFCVEGIHLTDSWEKREHCFYKMPFLEGSSVSFDCLYKPDTYLHLHWSYVKGTQGQGKPRRVKIYNLRTLIIKG